MRNGETKLVAAAAGIAFGAALVVTVPAAGAAWAAQPAQAGTAAASASTAATPPASQILNKYVEAIGGKEAWQKLTSWVAKGSFELEQMGGDATEEIDSKAPNKQVTITDAPSFLVRRGFNGTTGWEDMPQTGLHDLSGDQLSAIKRFSDFYYPIKLGEIYPNMTVKGKDTVSGHSVYVLEGSPDGSGAEQFYFDCDTGLLLRHTLEIAGPNGTMPFDSNFDDYRAVGDVKMPFLVHQSMGDFAWTIKLASVQPNVAIDDSKFEKPAADAGSAAPQN